ncbi:MAG: DUF4058 family protein [Planctomycetes bacterium]|nr:DUF4058 family protein [Planctomycetota bacterium]
MKSPFPGMDPYLEEHWRDVHHRLVTYASDRLRPFLPGALRARVEERVYVESLPGSGRGVYPDVRVIERVRRGARTVPAPAGVAIAEPLIVAVADEPVSEGYIEIIDVSSGRRVVTVIELLSPANKLPGDGQELYLRKRKQREIVGSTTSLVEVDLTRSGKRVMLLPPNRIPPSHRTTYQVCVRRGYRPLRVEVYDLPLRRRLPVIGVPLREGDPDAPLDLQALVDQCYENGGYDDTDYRGDPEPPLEPEDAAWADGVLRAKGLRPKARRRARRRRS